MPRFEKEGMAYLTEVLHEEHDRLYGYALRESDTETEVVNMRVTVLGITDKPAMQFMDRVKTDPGTCIKRQRSVYIPGEKAFRDVPVYDGEALAFGHQGAGQCIIEQITTTTLVSPEYDFVVDRAGSYCLHIRELADTYVRRVLG